MNRYWTIFFSSLILATGFSAAVRGAAAADSEPGKLQIGFEQRVRNENWNNIFDYNDTANDTRNQLRLRSRLWTVIPAGSTVEFSFGVGTESNERKGQPREFGELFVEQAYIHVKRLFINGLSLKVGRQDLVRGDGFIFSDATPYDGSRTAFSNALVLAWKRGVHTVELIGLSNPARDRYLPKFHSQSRMLQESDESAAGLYYSAKLDAGTSFDGYYFLKKECRSVVARNDPRYFPDRHVTLAGGRLVQRQGAWTASVEGGYQFGSQSGNIPIRAWGTIGSLRRVLESRRNVYVSGGFEALSGDNPSTPGTFEGWDPMFARFVKPSELYFYSGLNEQGIGYWSNLGMVSAEAGTDVGRAFRIKGIWNRMTAPQNHVGSAAIFGTGSLRGNNFQTRADFKLPDGWKAHIMLERMLPGSFYSHTSGAWFLRFETSVQFKTARSLAAPFRKL